MLLTVPVIVVTENAGGLMGSRDVVLLGPFGAALGTQVVGGTGMLAVSGGADGEGGALLDPPPYAAFAFIPVTSSVRVQPVGIDVFGDGAVLPGAAFVVVNVHVVLRPGHLERLAVAVVGIIPLQPVAEYEPELPHTVGLGDSVLLPVYLPGHRSGGGYGLSRPFAEGGVEHLSGVFGPALPLGKFEGLDASAVPGHLLPVRTDHGEFEVVFIGLPVLHAHRSG